MFVALCHCYRCCCRPVVAAAALPQAIHKIICAPPRPRALTNADTPATRSPQQQQQLQQQQQSITTVVAH